MNALRGGTMRRRDRLGRLRWALGALLALAATAAAAVFGLDAGRSVGQSFDKSTVATTGMPSRAPAPAPEEDVAPAPRVELDGRDEVRARLGKKPRAGLLFDVESGEALWSHKPERVLPIASLTKIMSALIVVERTSPRERAKVTKAALSYSGSGVGVLPRGKRVPVDGLLHGMLLVSGNDAAIALADHVAGSEREFVELMNRRAGELGLACTHFSSAYGMKEGDRSCAADLAALSRVVLQRPRIARVVRRRQAAIRFPISGGKLHLNSTNPLLRLRYPGTIGLKTGYTRGAGRTYVAVVRRRGRTLGLVLLGSPAPGVQAKRIFDRAFARAKRAERGAADRRRKDEREDRSGGREGEAERERASGRRDGRGEGRPRERTDRAGSGEQTSASAR